MERPPSGTNMPLYDGYSTPGAYRTRPDVVADEAQERQGRWQARLKANVAEFQRRAQPLLARAQGMKREQDLSALRGARDNFLSALQDRDQRRTAVQDFQAA